MQKVVARSGWAWRLVIYKLLLDACYLWFVGTPQFWWGVPFSVDLTSMGYFSAWIATVAVILLFRTTLQKPLEEYRFSEFVLLVLLLLSVIPGMTMCGMGAFPWEYRWAFYLYWLIFFLLGRGLSVVKLRDVVKEGRLSLRAARGLLFSVGIVFAVSIVFIFIYYGEGNFFSSGLQSQDVYIQREQFSNIAIMFPLNYVMANAVVVFMLLLLFFLGGRRYGWAGVVLFIWYMEFSCSANKIEFFSMLAGILVYTARRYLTTNRILSISIWTVLAGMSLLHFHGNASMLAFLKRTLFETNFLSYCYYDFFQRHAPMMCRFWGIPVLDRGMIPFMIGAQYLGNPTTHANNGLIGDASLMGGVVGVILGPVLWFVFLCVLNKAGNQLEWWMKLGISVCWGGVMQNSSFITNLLSHGGVALIVMAYLCSAEKKVQHVFWAEKKCDSSLFNNRERLQ